MLCFGGLLVLLVGVAWDQETADRRQIVDGEGVGFYQVEFQFSGAAPVYSSWGRVEVDTARVGGDTGWEEGFLNVITQAGWVVWNLWVDLGEPLDAAAEYFDLGVANGVRIDQLNALVEFTREPLLLSPEAVDDAASSPDLLWPFPVGHSVWDAAGVGETMTQHLSEPPPTALRYLEELSRRLPETTGYVLPDTINVQAALNQCVPMSVANSLQYLETRFGLQVPHDHRAGLGSDGTLVGQLDVYMERDYRRCVGTWFEPMLRGKMTYLADSNLADKLILRHQGRGWGEEGESVPDGDVSHGSIMSIDDGAKVTFEWLCEQVRHGEDVEIIFSYEESAEDGTEMVITGGHAVRVIACGTVLGIPWITYAHDADQHDDSSGLETPTVLLLDLDGDGMLNFGSASREIRFALSESLKGPVSSQDSGNTPPVARASCPRYSTEKPPADVHFVHERLSFNASGSSDQDGSIISYVWDFGDGCTEEGSRVHHEFEEAGTYNVCVTVTDNDGATDVDCCSVDIYVDIGGG